ncbi:DNA polymerase III subunit chi [Loktanella sp. DJP18]|uniref:DNA polymerase III subunit chi n=1 Tax=Loktanella sp. DJP18 TaxID=3409788 RepID=UPI003BB67BFB
MGAVYFYHLTDSLLEEALPQLIDRAQGQGWRVLVRGRRPALLDRLDNVLWQGPDDSFRAHGLAGDHDGDQPILLGVDTPTDGFACVMSVDGADLTPAEIAQAERACILFDGHDGDALQRARDQWKALTAAAVTAQYWAQDDGRWVKKAEAG